MSTETPTGRAIVTFARSWQALAAVRSLGRRGVEVVTGDEIALTPGALSRHSVDNFVYPNPTADPEGFLEALEAAIERFRPPAGTPYVLVPVHRETYEIARHRERLASRISIALPPEGLIDRVRDKGRLVEIARDIGVQTPRTWLPADASELEGVLEEIEPPVFVKVRTGVAGVGLERVGRREDVLAVFKHLAAGQPKGEAPPIVQALAPGDDYCVSALFDSGKPRAVLTYRNVRTIVDGAPGAVRQTVEAPVPEAAAIRLLEALGWHGIAEIDFMWTGRDDDPAYLIEINPRLFGGLFQAIASNVDYPWMLFQLALGHEVEQPTDIDLEVTTEAPVLGLLATLREAAESATGWPQLEKAWTEAKDLWTEGEVRRGIERFFARLEPADDEEGRLAALRRLLDERGSTVSQLFADEDPQAAFGLLYPLVVFWRRGRVDLEALLGAAPVDEEAGRKSA